MVRAEFLDDPEEMTPEERLAELAAILAGAWLRLGRSQHAGDASAQLTEKPLGCLRAPMAVLDRGPTPATENAA